MFNPKNRDTRYIITTLTIKALKRAFILRPIKSIMVTKNKYYVQPKNIKWTDSIKGFL